MRTLKVLAACFLLFTQAHAGTVSGSIQTATGGSITNGTLTFTLSQAAVASGLGSIATQSVSCYTSNAGSIVGVPDPLVLPVTSANYASGTLAAGTYYVQITYWNGSGESAASSERIVTLTSQGTLQVNAPVNQPTAASGYKIYIGSSSGSEKLQGAVTGWGNWLQNTSLAAGQSAPAANNSTCQIYFSDELVPSGTYYNVSFLNSRGTPVAGYPQTWCTYGGSSGLINVSLGTPTGNCGTNGVNYPTPILALPAGNTPQSISGALNLWSMYACTTNAMQVVGGSCAAYWGGGDLGAQVNAAYARLPVKTIVDSYFNPITVPYGTIMVPAGDYSYSTPIVSISPLVKIVGQGMTATSLKYTGSGTAVWLNPNSNVNEFVGGGGLFDLTIDGVGAGAGAIGMRTTDYSGFRADNVCVRNFSGAGSIGWLDDTINWYNEKMMVTHLALENNTVQWKISPANTSPGYPNTTFGYEFFDVSMMNTTGQTGLLMVNGTLSFSLIRLSINQVSTPANATAIQLQNSAVFDKNTVSIHIESPGGIGTGHEVSIAGGAFFASGVGVFDQGAPSSNVGTSSLGPVNYTAPLTSAKVFGVDENGNTAIAQAQPATALANASSPNLTITSNFWNGSASAADTWQFLNFLGSGTNPQSFLSISHTGSSNATTPVAVPQLAVAPNGPTSANTVIKIPGGQADFPTLTLPDATDTLVGKATTDIFSNKSTAAGPLTGTVGSGTAVMTTAAIIAGNCGVTVTVAATGVLSTDTITWSFNAAPAGSNAGLVSWPTANNVNFAYCPNTAETPAAATINWRVIR